MRLLVIEDDPDLNRQLTTALTDAGYVVDRAFDGEEGHFLGESEPYDAVILDIGLPKMDGISVLEAWRRAGRAMPVLILTGLDGVNDRVKGLDAGADDYLAKPFDLAELEARVRALARRGMSGGPTLINHGALAYDQVGRVARLNGGPVDLSAREVSLLEIFLQRAGRLVSKDQLVNHLCEWGEEVSANAIEVYVSRLRSKLEPAGIRIRTVRGFGYMLEEFKE